jgi:hypothetical protein
MTPPFSRMENPSVPPESSVANALAGQAQILQVSEIPPSMRGPITADVPHFELTGETNVPKLIEQGHTPIPPYTGFPYNMGYRPYIKT